MTPDLPGIVPDAPFCLHLAEGVDGGAAAEIRELDSRGLLGPNLLAVHAVGLDDQAICNADRAIARFDQQPRLFSHRA